jgi:hypothetical protein
MATELRSAVHRAPPAGPDVPAPRTPAGEVGAVRLLAYVFGVALLVAASVGTVASQSDRFVGVHELPPFVCDRVELVAGRSEGGAPDESPTPGGGNPVCPRRDA